MLSEKGLCKILKQAYKQGGYEIMPVAMADAEKICHIAALDWENQQSGGDPAVNVSLFDADEDVPMMGRTEE